MSAKVDIYKPVFRALKHTMGASEEKIFMKLVGGCREPARRRGAHARLGRGELIQGVADRG